MNGQLFTQDFLVSGIVQTPTWKALEDKNLGAFIRALRAICKPFSASSRPNEATTEQEIIAKVLAQLGWQDLTLVLAYLNAVAAGDLETRSASRHRGLA